MVTREFRVAQSQPKCHDPLVWTRTLAVAKKQSIRNHAPVIEIINHVSYIA